MTIQELLEILMKLPGEMTIILGGEQHYYDLGGIDWVDGGPVVYLLAGHPVEGHVPSVMDMQRGPKVDD